MLPLNSLSVSSCWSSWFLLKKPTVVAFVQDVVHVHVGVKLKARLLKPSIVLPLGKFLASGRHLHLVLTTFGKDQHGLKIRDIDHKDKQNFDAVVHITANLYYHFCRKFLMQMVLLHFWRFSNVLLTAIWTKNWTIQD